MTTTGQQIVDKAREYLGTPFRHQGRVKHVGVDCIGLLIGVAKELGIMDYDNTAYDRYPDGETLQRELDARFQCVPAEAAQYGDIMVFWFSRNTKHPQHIGFKTDKGIIHTYAHVGKVVEHGLDARWQKRLIAAYRFHGVE